MFQCFKHLVQTFAIWNIPEEEKEETTASLVAAREISTDATAAAAFSSRMDGIFTIKEEHRMKLKALLCGHHVFILLLTPFAKSLVKHHGTSLLATGW